jgi:hypothetical protein
MTTVQQINLGSYPNDGTGDDLRTAFEKVNSNFNLLFSESNVTTGINLGGGTGILYQKNSSTLNLEFKTLTSVDNSIVFNSNNYTVDLLAKTILQHDLTPRLGANLNLNAFNVYGGDAQTTVYGLDFPVANNIISALVNSNNLVLDMGSFDAPVGYQHFPRSGYNIDFNGTGVGSGLVSPLVNDYDFGSLAVQNNLQVGGSYLTLGGNLVTSGGNITFNASGNISVTLPSSGTLLSSTSKLSALASTTSAELATIISDETGSGSLVFNNNPTLSGAVSLASSAYILFSDGSRLSSAAGIAGGSNSTLKNGPYTLTLDGSGILNLPVSLRFQDGTVMTSTTNIIPGQLNQSGKFLTTNGSAVSWATIPVVAADAGTLTGTTLNSTVVSSSLTSVGTLTSLTVSGSITGIAATATGTSTASSLGYLGMPVNSQSGSTYAVVVGDLGKVIYFSATCTATIPASLPVGSSIAFVAGTGATITIAQASDSMYLGGTGTTGSRTLAAYGMATAIKMAATVWFINGTGLT